MTHEQIAEMMGIKIHRCGEEWGGTWGYMNIGCTAKANGYKTKEILICSVIEQRFHRDEIGRLALKLLLAYNGKPVAWFHEDFGTIELSRVKRKGWNPLFSLENAE